MNVVRLSARIAVSLAGATEGWNSLPIRTSDVVFPPELTLRDIRPTSVDVWLEPRGSPSGRPSKKPAASR